MPAFSPRWLNAWPVFAAQLSLERGPITVELEVGHEGHTPGSAGDMEALPVDERVGERLKELAKEGHDWKSIQAQLHALGSTICQEEDLHDAAQVRKQGAPRWEESRRSSTLLPTFSSAWPPASVLKACP